MLWNFFFNKFNKVSDPVLYDISRAGNFLTTIGKSSNFFLFCFISSSFRLRLLKLLDNQMKKSSIMAYFRRSDSLAISSYTIATTIKSSYDSSPNMTTFGKSLSEGVPLLKNSSVVLHDTKVNFSLSEKYETTEL
jgi:hypothetical protein